MKYYLKIEDQEISKMYFDLLYEEFHILLRTKPDYKPIDEYIYVLYISKEKILCSVTSYADRSPSYTKINTFKEFREIILDVLRTKD